MPYRPGALGSDNPWGVAHKGVNMRLTKEKQNKLIDAEIKKMLSYFTDISDEKKELARRLVERVAFMTITLEILEDDIKDKGPTYEFVQGAQKMIVENPSQKSYNTMINRYTAAYDKLMGLLPKETEVKEDDYFDKFVAIR